MGNRSINFDDGFRTYNLNGDSSRIIRVDTADYALITRFNQASEHINAELKKYSNIEIKPDATANTDNETAVKAIEQLDLFIKSEINYIFNSDVSEIVFQNASALSTRRGIPLYERFINAVIPEIEKDFKTELMASEKRVKNYTAQAQQFKNNVGNRKGKKK